MTNRYLTKSRYKLALQCPTKLFYTGKKSEYVDNSVDDPFLMALAKGGFQVGALAKAYYPDGVEVKSSNHDEALAETAEHLKKENVVIFEAALKFENLFVRVDILEKIGNEIRLIEVKAKSLDPSSFLEDIWDKRSLKAKKYKTKSDWREYLYDLSFQTHVLKKSLPKFKVRSFLMCVDKTVVATVDGLNQKFLLKNNNGRTEVITIGNLDAKALGQKILASVELTEIAEIISTNRDEWRPIDEKPFLDGIKYYSEIYSKDVRHNPIVGSQCKSCEFRGTEKNLKSGFAECWGTAKKISASDCEKPFVFDLWNYRKSDDELEKNIVLLKDMDPESVSEGKDSDIGGLANFERQRLQIEYERDQRKDEYVDLQGIRAQIKTWTYPLHFIDFETCMVAIPFSKGRRPYEQTAFQFSHHIMEKDGSVRHAGEYINAIPGAFPNFEFVRELKKALEGDNGTIFRYSSHENSVLCQIHDQLEKSDEHDRDDLMAFIETITAKRSEDKKSFVWEGSRNMVDLCEIIKRFWFSPLTNGSNSIKYVLPAILAHSKFLQDKYSKPMYGKNKEIHSINFPEQVWLQYESDGSLRDPYKLLPPMFTDYDKRTLELLSDEDDVRNGGAAMTAYARMQFTQMTDVEREKIRLALLKYCELDTLAMVMLVEHWMSLLSESKRSSKVG